MLLRDRRGKEEIQSDYGSFELGLKKRALGNQQTKKEERVFEEVQKEKE